MVAVKLASAAIAAISFLASTVVADVDPIVIKGSKFFYKTNGTEFFIKGAAYQQNVGGNGTTGGNTDFTDPLTDSAGCARDIPLLTGLQTNTIRVYAIDTTQSHDDCMTALQNAGIYVIADLGSPNNSINRDSPAWDDTLYARFTSVVDTMSKYNNVIGFFAGNEVVNNATNANAIPFVKAAVRDIKAYIKQKNYRPMGVGYAADDDATIRDQVRPYMNCGPSEDSIDFFGYNIYSWCGDDSSFQTSGYADRTEEFSNYSVPAFFAEYGCNQPTPRQFDDTPVIYSDQMTGVWSGAIVYEYFQADNNFGECLPSIGLGPTLTLDQVLYLLMAALLASFPIIHSFPSRSPVPLQPVLTVVLILPTTLLLKTARLLELLGLHRPTFLLPLTSSSALAWCLA